MNSSAVHQNKGFTLVELAIVMVIIGLLIGGILKGQELIANARISSTVAQIKAVTASAHTFEDKYNALPGDMPNPSSRLQNCVTSTPCGATLSGGTRGNRKIDGTTLGAFPTATSEAGVFFTHLAAADLISGIDSSTSNMAFGKMLPTVRTGGGMWVNYADTQPAITSMTIRIGWHYAIINGIQGTPMGTSGALSPATAAQIDRKMDDGLPFAGSTQSDGTNCTIAGGTRLYNETLNDGVCTLISRVLN